eukprot:390709-Pleurochrysis_carterae.AAC.2
MAFAAGGSHVLEGSDMPQLPEVLGIGALVPYDKSADYADEARRIIRQYSLTTMTKPHDMMRLGHGRSSE